MSGSSCTASSWKRTCRRSNAARTRSASSAIRRRTSSSTFPLRTTRVASPSAASAPSAAPADRDAEGWRGCPDGRMETTYRLRPNLTWHDGTPLTPEDFLFSLRVYSTPALGLAPLPPFNAIEEVVPTDPRTIVIRWRRPYPDADQLAQYTFPP